MSGWEGKVVVVPLRVISAGGAGAAAVVVAGEDAAAVGEAVGRLRADGVRAAGFVGAPDDPAAAELAAELFPGAEVVIALTSHT